MYFIPQAAHSKKTGRPAHLKLAWHWVPAYTHKDQGKYPTLVGSKAAPAGTNGSPVLSDRASNSLTTLVGEEVTADMGLTWRIGACENEPGEGMLRRKSVSNPDHCYPSEL